MKLFGVGLMWVASGDDAGTTRAAGADGEHGSIESHASLRHALQVRRSHRRVSVRCGIVPSQIICDDQNDVGGWFGGSHAP